MPVGLRSPFQGFRPPGRSSSATPVAPTNLTAPQIVGLPGVGVVLSLTGDTWTGYPSPTFSWQWKRDGGNISGATNSTYTLQVADIGATITCTVTAANGTAPNASANTSNSVGPVVALPSNDSAPSIAGTAVVGNTATVAAGSWTGAESYAYQWYQDGVAVGGATSSAFVMAIPGVTVYCVVTATNTGGSTPQQSSNSLGPVGLAPFNTVAPTVSGTAAAGFPVTCSPGTWSGYPLSFTYAYQWYADGVAISGATSSSLPVTAIHAGKLLTCTVAATNSTDTGTPQLSSNSVGPATSAPTFLSDPVLAGAASVGQTLTVTTPGLYAYPAPTSTTYAWFADGAPIVGATGASYVLTDQEEGDTITVTVTVTNSQGSDSDTSNGIGPIAPPEPVAGTWDLTAEDGLILVAEDGERLVAEDYTNDILSNWTFDPQPDGTSVGWTINSLSKVGTFFAIVVADGTAAPLASDVEDWATNGHAGVLWRVAVSMTSMTDGTPGITGLEQSTVHDAYAVVRLSSEVGNYSNVASGTFTTADTPPVLTDIRAVATSTTSCLFSVITDDGSGSIKWAVFPSSATPTKANILNGTGGAVNYGSKSVSGAGRKSVVNIGSLTAGGSWKVCAYHVDAGLSESEIISSSTFTTEATQTTSFQYANAGVATGLTLTNLAATTAQTDPLGGSNAIKLLRNPGGVATACSVGRSTTGGVVPTTFKVQFYVKKVTWASSAAWARFRITSTDVTPVMPMNLDTGSFGTTSAAITNKIAVPLEDGYIFVRFDCSLYKDGTDDTDGLYAIELTSSSTAGTIQTSGDHAINLYDYKIIYP